MKSALGTVVMGMATLFAAGASRAAETELVNAQTPWRAFLVVGPRLETKTDGTLRYEEGRRGGGRGGSNPAVDLAGLNGEQSRFSRLPAAGWTQPGYDASPWARYLQSDLADFLGDYGVPRYSFDQRDKSWPALLCLRTTFGIADPAKAADLKVGVTGLGGAVVHVNGREVGRGFLPQGPLHALTPAEDYPVEAYTLDDGVTPLPELSLRTKPDPKQLPRYQRRIRTFTVSVPKEVLVKGANVVTVEIHPALVSGPMARFPWIHLGVHGITLTSASGAGVIPYAEALQGTRVWSANPEEQIAETPTPVSLIRRDEGRPVIWMRGRALRGIQCGNPFEPVLPVRMAVPRNGVASGQTVVTDLAGLRDVKAAMGVLKGPPGEIPASAVEVRYAVQHAAMHFCDAFLPAPPEGAKTVPVWVIVQAPKNQAPGWYTGALKVQANGQEFTVPVQVLVTGATLPDARDFTSHIGAASSPETLAAYYKVEPWSDQHLRLMEPSLRMAGQLGNDVLHVPVILGGMQPAVRDWFTGGSKARGGRRLPLVRWVKTGDRVAPDFSLLEKFLEVYARHCAPPQALSLYVWDSGCSTEVADAYENRRIQTREVEAKSPLLVLQWDPQTGATTEMPAPNFGEAGAEAFWRPLFEGVRAIVVKRGWSERVILAGLGGDLRPGEKTGELLRQWAPYMRWNILSHFSGDPAPKDGKMIATGKLEVGLKEYPWRAAFLRPYTAAELEKDLTGNADFLDLPTARWHWQDDSAPLVFRTTPMLWGVLGHLGLDFWPEVKGVPKNSSFFTASNSMTVPGPNGAEPTVRFQMMREGVQDAELRALIVRAYLKLPEDQRKPYRDLLDEFVKRVTWSAGYLTQCELGYDWRAYVAKVQLAAAVLAGVKAEAQWEQPPQ